MRIGHGYDVHRLKEGRELVLCGVKIPYELGLDGHSDADVALHALMDALLGAGALGDIGQRFPDTDEKWRGADSAQLLKNVYKEVKILGYYLENADITIIAQKPKLAPYIEQMRSSIAKTLAVNISQISVKATTEEGLSFTGAGLGICAHAVVLIKK